VIGAPFAEPFLLPCSTAFPNGSPASSHEIVVANNRRLHYRVRRRRVERDVGGSVSQQGRGTVMAVILKS